jgi:hypothetical protein
VLLLPLPQAERRFGLAEERWLAVTDGCRRQAVGSFFPHQPYLHPPCRHAEWSIHGFSVQSDYNNHLLPTTLRDRKALIAEFTTLADSVSDSPDPILTNASSFSLRCRLLWYFPYQAIQSVGMSKLASDG